MSVSTFTKDKRGSMTIEAAMIFSLVFFCVISLMYAGMLLYQQSYMQTLADRAAQMGALTWSNPQSDMYIGHVNEAKLEEKDLYWRVFDFSKSDRESKVEKYINFQINAFGIIKSGTPVIEANVENCIIYNKIVVNASKSYDLPIGSLLKIFGLKESFTIKAKSVAVIHEPAEFIRTTDLILDSGKELDRKTGGHIKSTGESLKRKISDIVGKARELLNKFSK